MRRELIKSYYEEYQRELERFLESDPETFSLEAEIHHYIEILEPVLRGDGQEMWQVLDRIISAKNSMEGIVAKEMYIREFLDFGCGKSYLTFAIYYYLHELKGYDIRIIGLDLKTDVIYACNQLAKKYGYRKLKFMEGNIADYTGSDEVDMVVTLHACDTATDFALAKAVGWKAKVILSVPCCQHEVNRQIANETLAPLFSYGLIKERMAALVTDAMRAEYLKREGYDTQILEFIDMEHTPKNILIRAIYTGNKGKNTEAIRTCEEMLHIDPMLGRLLDQQNEEGEKGV